MSYSDGREKENFRSQKVSDHRRQNCYSVPYTYEQCMGECTSGENPGYDYECEPICRPYKTRPWYMECIEPMAYTPSIPYDMSQLSPSNQWPYLYPGTISVNPYFSPYQYYVYQNTPVAESIPFDSPQIKYPFDYQTKTVRWRRGSNVGDCTIKNMKMTFYSYGEALFEADVRSTDTDDQWVFYGGITVHDKNGVELWRTGKLIGPKMPKNQWRKWNQTFSYPSSVFDRINSVRIHRMHC